MLVKELLNSWSFIHDRTVPNHGKLTFCQKNSNRKVTYDSIEKVSQRIQNADAVREYSFKDDAFIVISM